MNLFQESLSVHVDGYDVRTVTDAIFGNEDTNDSRCIVPSSTRFVRRRPPSASALLSGFMAIDPTESGFLAFATRYGMLLSADRQGFLGDRRPVERVLDWHRAWNDMYEAQRAIRVAQLDVGERNPAEDYVRFSADQVEYRDPEVGITRTWPMTDERLRLLEGLRPGERARQVAYWLAQERINDWLKTETSIRLMFSARGTAEPPRMAVHASSLSGVMWAMLARVVDEGRRLAVCERCGAIMEPKRSTRRWCSDACRKAGQRQRRANRA